MKKLKKLLKLTSAIGVGFACGLCWNFAPKSIINPEISRKTIQTPTIREIQKQLIDKGYKIKLDGKIETGGETLEAWDKEICTQFSVKHIERMEK